MLLDRKKLTFRMVLGAMEVVLHSPGNIGWAFRASTSTPRK
jgi:hypothetical protein